MNEEHVRQWTAALRSGEYQQGHGLLGARTLSEARFTYCCMGVACVVAGIRGEETTVRASDPFAGWRDGLAFDGQVQFPPFSLHEWLGISGGGAFPRDDQEVYIDWPRGLSRQGCAGVDDGPVGCAYLNDHAHLTFPQIADLIDYFGVRSSYLAKTEVD